jgi:hypothetical protein
VSVDLPELVPKSLRDELLVRIVSLVPIGFPVQWRVSRILTPPFVIALRILHISSQDYHESQQQGQ